MDEVYSMARWQIYHGSWWMFQWCLDWFLSLGVHVDFKKRLTGSMRERYGPYADVHFGPLILSVGWFPYRSIGEQEYR